MSSTPASSLPPRVNLKATLLSMERTLIHSALIACDWNQRKAAAALGVQPTTLSQKMQRLKLRPQPGETRGQGVVMRILIACAVLGASVAARSADVPKITGAFVTTLGADIVAVESYTRTSERLEGDILLRVPGTTRYHYALRFAKDGSVQTSEFSIKPMGAPAVDENRRLILEFGKNSLRLLSIIRGEQQVATRPGSASPNVVFLGGYGSSFGLYGSLGMYEHLFQRLAVSPEKVSVETFAADSGEPKTRLFRRLSPTSVDVDYFKAVWINMTLDETGRILAADATQTTERTLSKRVDSIDIDQLEREFLARDKAGKGMGAASPNVETRAAVGGASIVLRHGAPRLRGRAGVMKGLAESGRAWRTGANEATTIETNRGLLLGGVAIPAGKYSLWTLVKPEGVDLIVNRETGQWGTAYNPARDLVRLPLTVAAAETATEIFAIDVTRTETGSALRFRWDTFVWTVAISEGVS